MQTAAGLEEEQVWEETEKRGFQVEEKAEMGELAVQWRPPCRAALSRGNLSGNNCRAFLFLSVFPILLREFPQAAPLLGPWRTFSMTPPPPAPALSTPGASINL